MKTTRQYLQLAQESNNENQLIDILNNTTSSRIKSAVLQRAKEIELPLSSKVFSVIKERAN